MGPVYSYFAMTPCRVGKPHFEPPTRDRGSDIGGNFLKNWPKRGYPCFGHFLEILGISIESGPENPSRQRKRYTDLRGSSPRSSRGSIWALDTQGWQNGPFSLLTWIPWEARIAHRFHRKSPKSPKSAQNRGTPLFGQFLKARPLPRGSRMRRHTDGFTPLD